MEINSLKDLLVSKDIKLGENEKLIKQLTEQINTFEIKRITSNTFESELIEAQERAKENLIEISKLNGTIKIKNEEIKLLELKSIELSEELKTKDKMMFQKQEDFNNLKDMSQIKNIVKEQKLTDQVEQLNNKLNELTEHELTLHNEINTYKLEINNLKFELDRSKKGDSAISSYKNQIINLKLELDQKQLKENSLIDEYKEQINILKQEMEQKIMKENSPEENKLKEEIRLLRLQIQKLNVEVQNKNLEMQILKSDDVFTNENNCEEINKIFELENFVSFLKKK